MSLHWWDNETTNWQQSRGRKTRERKKAQRVKIQINAGKQTVTSQIKLLVIGLQFLVSLNRFPPFLEGQRSTSLQNRKHRHWTTFNERFLANLLQMWWNPFRTFLSFILPEDRQTYGHRRHITLKYNQSHQYDQWSSLGLRIWNAPLHIYQTNSTRGCRDDTTHLMQAARHCVDPYTAASPQRQQALTGGLNVISRLILL